MIDEERIIKKAKSGDRQAFEEIINNYKNYIFAIILNFIKDKNEVENIAQEVFLHIYLSLDKYESNNFKSWISRLTANKTIDYLRNKERHFKEETMEYSKEIIEIRNIEEVKTPEEEFLKSEKEKEVRNICKSIPEIYSNTIIEFYVYGKSYIEIAKKEGVSEKTIASRLYRGKNLLKEKWRNKNETL